MWDHLHSKRLRRETCKTHRGYDRRLVGMRPEKRSQYRKVDRTPLPPNRCPEQSSEVLFLSVLQGVISISYLHQQALLTRTLSGRAMFQMCGVFAEFERGMIRERVNTGLARGQSARHQARPPSGQVIDGSAHPRAAGRGNGHFKDRAHAWNRDLRRAACNQPWLV